MKTLGKCVGSIIGEVETAVQQMSTILAQEGYKKNRNSGYFTLRDGVTGRIIFMVQIGICPDDMADKFCEFSQEKGNRLKWDENVRHVTSWQSRDPDNKKYGGAIKAGPAKNLILSFSGLPELADEAVMVAAAYRLGWLNHHEVADLYHINDNAYLLQIFTDEEAIEVLKTESQAS
jgi:hypothetical protein